MLLPFQGDHHLHEITQGAATLYPGLCAFALTARLNEGPFTRQSFALADAKLCIGDCKALRGQLQSFALTVAKLCV